MNIRLASTDSGHDEARENELNPPPQITRKLYIIHEMTGFTHWTIHSTRM